MQTNHADDVIWTAEAIARHINRTRSQTYYLIAKGIVPAKKLGAKIVARRSELDRALGALPPELTPNPSATANRSPSRGGARAAQAEGAARTRTMA